MIVLWWFVLSEIPVHRIRLVKEPLIKNILSFPNGSRPYLTKQELAHLNRIPNI